MPTQYLSTDPNAGKDEKGYLSTDPNAGNESKKEEPKGEHPHARVARLVKENLPAIGATGAALLSGPGIIPAMGAAALGGMTGRAGQRVLEGAGGSVMDAIKDVVGEGGIQGAIQGAGGVLGKGATMLARPLMRAAIGAQTAVRRAFPTVNLERVALKEGVSATNLPKAQRLGQEAAQNVTAAAKAADAAGAPKITAKEILPGLRPVFDRAAAAERGGVPNATKRVIETAKDISQIGRGGRGGLSVEDALTAKQEWQRMAKPAYAAQPGALPAPDPRVSRAVASGMTKAVRSRSPEIGQALDRSQELMALERALGNVNKRAITTRLLLGAAAGGPTGYLTGDPIAGLTAAAIPATVASPRVLSNVALGMNKATGNPQANAALMRAIRSLFGTESEP